MRTRTFGPARRADTEVKPKTLRNRRSLDRKHLQQLMAAGTALPPGLATSLAWSKLGRPRLADHEIQRPEHAEALRKRLYVAACAERAAVREAEAAGAMVDMAGAHEAAAEANRLAAKKRAKLARLVASLAEHNPDGCTGLLFRQRTVELPAASGECIVCCADTGTLTPCCSKLPDKPVWLCATCVNQNALVYARARTTDGVRRDDGGPRAIECGHLGSRCPWCRVDGAFTTGARALVMVAVGDDGIITCSLPNGMV
jgi:hypothetical protein